MTLIVYLAENKVFIIHIESLLLIVLLRGIYLQKLFWGTLISQMTICHKK